MDGPFLLIVGCVLMALALFLFHLAAAGRSRRAAWGLEEADPRGLFSVSAMVAFFAVAFLSFGLLLIGWLAVALPLIAALWFFGGLWFIYQLCGHRAFRWLSYLSGGVGGLILVVLIPAVFDWGRLYVRGVRVRAEVVSMTEGSTYDFDDEGYQSFPATHVTYQFEAEVSGQQRQFRRQGELTGRYQKGSGFINVLYDPADPNHSRMTREFHWTRNGLVAAAVFLALGVGFFLFSRRGSRGACDASAAPKR